MLSAQVSGHRPSAEWPPHRERLLGHALLLHMWLERPTRVPARWHSATFARTVDLVRTHLRPIVTCDLLALSYAQEHFHISAVGPPPDSLTLMSRDATEVAYAIRWLELDREQTLQSWPSLMNRLSIDSGRAAQPDRGRDSRRPRLSSGNRRRVVGDASSVAVVAQSTRSGRRRLRAARAGS